MFERIAMRDGALPTSSQEARRAFYSFPLASICVGLCASILLFSFEASAYDSAQVLPQKINSPMMRMGIINGVGQRYDSNGSLMTLSDLNSIDFDGKELAKIEPRVQQLVNVLNQFGQQEMGTALTLGTLRIYTEPEVKYVAPLHAYGINNQWTVAVGLPIVTYSNRISMGQTGSNLAEIRAMAGGISRDLDDAFNELDVGLVASAEKELSTKGYKPLENRNETIVGDLQIASLYQVYNKNKTILLLRSVLNLPTGPGDDPDDLADLGAFGYSSIDQIALATYQLLPKIRLSAKAGVRYNLPDEVVKRVPKNADDSLPDASTKQKVRRKPGDSFMASAGANYQFSKRWSAGGAYDIALKGSDSYSGDVSTSDYSLLSRKTNSDSHRMRVGMTYDTVNAYMSKEAMLPAMISYEFSDTIRGFNIERQTIHELWLTLFF